MIRCTPDGACALGLPTMMTTTATDAAPAAAHAGCGCSGGSKSPALIFVAGALVGAVVILALRA